MAALTIGGLVAMLAIPKESTPEIIIPIGVINTVLPGASANDVERLITDKIEDRVLSVEHVSKVTSTSGDGVSSIVVEFDANANIDKSIQSLKDEVDKVHSELPTEALVPTVSSVNFSDQPILIASISGNLAPAELTALGESVKSDIERVPGVSSVDVSGVRKREVQVILQQAKLRQYNLTVSDVTSAISSSGLATPEGSIVVGGVSYAVRLEAGLSTPEQVGNVSIAGPGGATLHIRDIANVIDGLQNPSTYSRVSVNGKPSQPSLTLSIHKSKGGNILSTANAVKKELNTLKGTTLSGTETVISFNAADKINSDLTELTRAGFETVVLVMIILLLTLGWREAIVAAASIPLSFLIAFIGMYATGNTINVVSLFSLILAIGILVDSGIVIVEAIHTHLEKLGNKFDAAVEALREYAWPLFAGTLTTVAVFVPLFFLSGIVGKFIASIPFTIIFVLLASIFVALGLVPLLAIFLVKKSQHSQMENSQERIMGKIKVWYEAFLRGVLGNKKWENRFLIAMGIGFILALCIPGFGLVTSIFFPAEDSDTLYVQVEKPQGTALGATDLSVREVEEILYTDNRIESFVTDVGEGSAFTGSGGAGAQLANITLSLKKDRKKTSSQITEELRKELSPVTSATVTVASPNNGPSSGQPISVTFSGTDTAALTKTVDMAAQTLAGIKNVTNINTSTRNDSSEFVVSLDTAKATQLGISPLAVASTLRTALYGTKATSLRSGTNDIDVYVKLDLNPAYTDPSETNHASIDAIRSLTIPGMHGAIPLSSIATVSYAPAQTVITHEEGKRTASLGADVAKGGNAQVITTQFQKAMAKVNIPDGVKMKIGGETEDVSKTFMEMVVALIAGAALMLGILMLEFNSFRQSFYLLLVIPLSLIGVFLGLLVTNSPLSLPSMLGVIALAGVIINHAIILMDSIARIGREQPGHSLTDVVVDAASTRLRPILLTTITTVVGMIPLSLASPEWGPLAFAIMFGLAFSLMLTLVLIPILYNRWPGKRVRKEFAARSSN